MCMNSSVHSTIPLVRVLPFLLIGSLLPGAPGIGWAVITFTLMLFVLIPVCRSYSFRSLYGVSCFVAFIAVGVMLSGSSDPYRRPTHYLNMEQQYFMAHVREVTMKPRSVECVVEVIGCVGAAGWNAASGLAVIYLERTQEAIGLAPHTTVLSCAELEEFDRIDTAADFDYGAYMASKDIFASAYVPACDWKVVTHGPTPIMQATLDRLRCYTRTALGQVGLDSTEMATASALIMGDKQLLESDQRDSYARAGALHVLAVSGLHVGIIYMFIGRLFFFLRRWRYVHVMIIVTGIWGYAFFTGASPSVLRSATMFSFLAVGQAIGRGGSSLNLLAASAILLIAVEPTIILQVGFQLSYAAVAAIIILFPGLQNWVTSRWWLVNKLWSLTAVSIAAQLGTFPLSVYYFHQFPNYALFTNLIVIPCATLALIAGILLLVTWRTPCIPEVLGCALDGILSFMNERVAQVASMPGAVLDGIHIHVIEVVFWYLLIIGAWTAYARKRAMALFLSIGILIVLIVLDAIISD